MHHAKQKVTGYGYRYYVLYLLRMYTIYRDLSILYIYLIQKKGFLLNTISQYRGTESILIVTCNCNRE